MAKSFKGRSWPIPDRRRVTCAPRCCWGAYDKGDGGPGGWWILDEPKLHLGADVLVPDLAGWRRERMPALPESAWFELAPDWVCEVLSPRTARTDRVIKMPLYASYGVRHLWLIDPDLKILEAYELAGAHWMLISSLSDDAEVRIPPSTRRASSSSRSGLKPRSAGWARSILTSPSNAPRSERADRLISPTRSGSSP